ncbi:MAG: hypothetical protein ABEI52_03395 [Halobacteriaceae archaeon]
MIDVVNIWEIIRRQVHEKNEVEPPLELPSDEELFGREPEARHAP